jgi:hypothetical protein
MAMTPQERGKLGAIALKKRNAKIREDYYLNPKVCANDACTKPISFHLKGINTYCSRSCSRKSLNVQRVYKRSGRQKYCTVCDRVHFMKGDKCLSHQIDFNIVNGVTYDRNTLKKWLKKNRGVCCEICKLDKWSNEEIPLEVHHVDGDAGNNFPDNLQLLCPNCHAQTPNAKGRNRGYGRLARGLFLY